MPPLAGLHAASHPVLVFCCQHPLLACMVFPEVLPRKPLPTLCSPTLSASHSANGV